MDNRQMEDSTQNPKAESRSLVAAAKKLYGRNAPSRQQEKRQRGRSFSTGDSGETGRVYADGYVRRSPVQPVKEKPDYRQKRVLKAVQLALLLAFLAALVYVAFRYKILSF